MGRIPRDEEAKLSAEFEQEADDNEQWEEVPEPIQHGRRTLGTQVTIRLGMAAAEQLRQIARDRGVRYTALLRTWIEERLSSEIARIRPERLQITEATESVRMNAIRGSGEGQETLISAGSP